MNNDFYDVGNYNVQCDICGKKRKRNQCKMTWDGFLACTVEKCWYPKHPNEYPIPVINDGLPVPNSRPRNIVYLAVPPITSWDDPTLTWETISWRWDDDPSNAPLFYDGNP
jgi:hypothetical protein